MSQAFRPLGLVSANFDARRIPLSSRERATRRGKYPYYGAAGVIDHVDEYLFKGLHLLVGEDGTVETSSHAPMCQLATGAFWVNNHAHVLRGSDDLDTRFLYYALGAVDVRPFITGAVQPKLSQSNLNKIEVFFPERQDRESIVGVLGALDDKIDLNRRMSETLEEMARALFKSWFIDFDPVRAKAEGRQPEGIGAETAALFPAELEEGLPKGWRKSPIRELCERIENGGTPKRAEQRYWSDGVIDWYKTGELGDGPLIGAEELISADGLAESSCKLWPSGTVLIALYASPTVGRLGILTAPATANQACSALVPRSPVGSQFVFHSLWAAREELQRIAVGAAQQNISKKIVESYEVVIATDEITRCFREFADPLFERQVCLMKESRTLAELRDTLLPKLMSGELRVRDAEAIAGKVL